MPDREPRLVAALELALRKRGFFITRRFYRENGDCVIRFRAIAGPFAGFCLAHELIVESETHSGVLAIAEVDNEILIDSLMGEMAPFKQALLN